MFHALAVDIPLALGVLAALISAIGVLRMRHPLDRLHYLTVACTLAPALIAVAGLVQGVSTQSGIKSVLILVVLAATSPVSTLVIARAIRARDTGALEPEQGEVARAPGRPAR